MPQTLLKDHVNKGPYFELCPNCFKSITPYWLTVSMKKQGKKTLIKTQRKCSHCGFVEQEDDLIDLVGIETGCYNCLGGCNGGCK